MAARERVAFDIDDVFADTTEALRLYVNQQTGRNLTKEHYLVPATYWGYYQHVWEQAGITGEGLIESFHVQMGVNQDNILPVKGSQEHLKRIAEKKDPVAVTSRELFMEDATRTWVEKHFEGIFSEIVLLGHIDSAQQTKGDACLALGAKKLFDDNIGHCESAEVVGVEPILYGDYGWHHELKSNMIRCKNWPAVGAYLDG